MSNELCRKVSAQGGGGVTATVVVTVYRGHVWLSIQPPFTWEAIMDPARTTELIAILSQAVTEARTANGQQKL
ncbi:MAG: hypothetical protein LC808_38685 [Actinobacteria bacterium]|nr:hypothetical protein [Actinomycetota bacterium]